MKKLYFKKGFIIYALGKWIMAYNKHLFGFKTFCESYKVKYVIDEVIN